MNYTKPGGGGKPQPYIPKGNGDKSGEYTNKDNEGSINNILTKEQLFSLLSIDEITYIIQYSDFVTGTELNKAIRNNNLSKSGLIMSESIKNAIFKNKLMKSQKIYRGIHLPRKLFNKLYLNPYLQGKFCIGPEICSTSTDIRRAFAGAQGSNNEIGIIIEGILPKGYCALPIENISLNKNEKEILVTKPKYKIVNIEKISFNNVIICIKILED